MPQHFSFPRWLLALWLVPLVLHAQQVHIGKAVKGGPHAAAVSAEHPAAVRVGLDIMAQGGNAYDAAVAVHFALAVVMPRAGNLGGGGFAVIRDAAGEAAALDFRETAPIYAQRDMYLDSAGRLIPGASLYGGLAVAVPGAVAGMWQLHQRGGRLPWEKVIAPAIALADTGFFLTPYQARLWNRYRQRWAHQNPDCPFPFGEGPFKAGRRIVQKALARTLQTIARKKAVGFYRGWVAKALVRTVHQQGGIIGMDDLRQYYPVWRRPLVDTIDSVTLITMPPPSAGGIALIQLYRILKPYPWKQWRWTGWPATWARVVAMRHVFAARLRYVGDPAAVHVPVQWLISRAFADSVRALLNQSEPILEKSAGKSHSTTHLSVVDSAGNAVSITTTLNSNFGSLVYVCDAGFFLNNEMDDFTAQVGKRNQFGLLGSDINMIRPRRRPVSSMTPTIVLVNGRLRYVLGTPGGTTIPTTVFQVLARALWYGDSPPAALAAPRIHHQGVPRTVFFERMPWTVRWRLHRRGLRTRRRSLGRISAITVRPHHRQAVGDPRSDNVGGILE